MKARTDNGNIKTYSTTPKSWGAVICGFDTFSDSKLQTYGFYNVEDIKTTHSDFDGRIHNVGALSFDTDNNVYKYAKENKTFSQTVAELKTQKINNLNHIYHSELSKTDWIVTKHLELGQSVPQDTLDARAALRTECNNHESSINSKTTKNAVVTYDLPNFR
tara:strand:- start:14852 stop:15337 length:486 start_codon:yes stop_codon:yes gene_type:complete